MMQELARKFIHVIFGLGIAAIVLVLDHTTAMAVLAGGLLFGLILIDLIRRGYTLPVFSAVVNYVDRNDPLPGKGALYFVGSALTCVILFPGRGSCTGTGVVRCSGRGCDHCRDQVWQDTYL